MATGEISRPPLPPYPELILQAIEALNEPNGSNKTSISRYIESKYGDLPAGHAALLTHHLSRMKETGELVFWKNNYTKPDPNAPPRRGRGRPPKPKDPLGISGPVSPSAGTRSRPPKDPYELVAPTKPKPPTGSGRPRGRPRKTVAGPAGGGISGGATAAAVTGTGRPRGRPPKVKPPPALQTGLSIGN